MKIWPGQNHLIGVEEERTPTGADMVISGQDKRADINNMHF